MPEVWWTTYLLYMVDMFFDWQSAFLWLAIVFSHLVDLSFIRISKLHSGTFQEQWNDSLNNYGDRIYPIELAIWITIVTARSASSFDLYLVIDLEDQLREKKLSQWRRFRFSISELLLFTCSIVVNIFSNFTVVRRCSVLSFLCIVMSTILFVFLSCFY